MKNIETTVHHSKIEIKVIFKLMDLLISNALNNINNNNNNHPVKVFQETSASSLNLKLDDSILYPTSTYSPFLLLA